MSIDISVNELNEVSEKVKIRDFLKSVDDRFYYRIIENRQSYTGRYFPHRGETGSLFFNTYHYVALGKKKE